MLRTPSFWVSGLQDCGQNLSVVLKQLHWWYLVTETLGNSHRREKIVSPGHASSLSNSEMHSHTGGSGKSTGMVTTILKLNRAEIPK